MCGIVGIFNFKTRRPVDDALLTNMRDTMVHRGPDDGGIYTSGHVGLGHRRLSILDLSPAGHQPMVSPSGQTVIAFNGEVYNYREIHRDELKNRPLQSHSDTEVLLHLFEEQGVHSVTHYNGMYAIAFYEPAKEKLTLIRDRAGVKPLYYTYTSDGIAFASELKALLLLPGVERRMVPERIRDYLSLGYVPGQETIYKGIYRLPPAHTLEITNSEAIPKVYWELTYTDTHDMGERETVQAFRDLFNDAVDLRLRSDVPLGIFLSGGLDSSSVVAQLSRAGVTDLKTFSVAYDFGPKYNETPFARLVAKHFHTEHHEVYVTAPQFAAAIPDFIHHMDEPVTEAAAINLLLLSRETRKSVTVVLSGEGADELLAGYDIYKYFMMIDKYRRLPSWLRHKMIEPFLRSIHHPKLQKYVDLASRPLHKSYAGVSLYEESATNSLLSQNFKNQLNQYSVWDSLSAFFPSEDVSLLNRMLSFDMRTWLVDNLLIKADKMSMAPSLELRVPFLDYRMIEFCAKLPQHYKIRSGEKKYLLKKAMEDILPSEIIKRPKVGFPTPLAHMFRTELFPYVEATLGSQAFKQHGLFSADTIDTLLGEHKSGAIDHHRLLWQILVLAEWMQKNEASVG